VVTRLSGAAAAWRRAASWGAVGVVLLALGGCGKKGPPLAPLVSLPVAPTEVSTQRVGDRVVVRFTVPVANVSGVRPADLARVDVYAWTGEALEPEQVFRYAPVVSSVPVRRPPPPLPEGAPPPPPAVLGPGLEQGAVAEVVEVLQPSAYEPLVVPGRREPARPEPDLRLMPPDLGPPMLDLPPRHYVVVGVNHRGRRGPPASAVAAPLWASPRPPGQPGATVTEKEVVLSWTAPEGIRRSMQPPTLAKPPAVAAAGAKPRATGLPAGTAGAVPAASAPPASAPAEASETATPPEGEDPAAAEKAPAAKKAPAQPAAKPSAKAAPAPADTRLPSRVIFPWPAGSTAYHVYEVLPKGAELPEVPPGAGPPYPRRLTPEPLQGTTFTDTRLDYGTERCYAVRTVETVGTMRAESVASAPVCITARDVFPPATPRSLAAIASDGAISLIWDANTEPDLAGYIVLRAVAPGAPVEPITPAPIRETTFRDTTVTPGTRYVYAVVAVDTADPPNASPPSDPVEETAR
jgi:predicted small lipoprotein YifL